MVPGAATVGNSKRLPIKLFNGDIGILLDDPETGSLRVFFPTEDGTFRKVLPGNFPPVRRLMR